MKLCRIALACLLVIAPCRAAIAADGPPPAPTSAPAPSAAEAVFLATIMRDLPRRFPTTQSAIAAGYERFTNEDETGAISYVNIAHWNSTDPDVPAQLWYDVRGRLIGADYSVRKDDSPQGPSLFGIDRSRFSTVGAHIHFVTCKDTATQSGCVYGKAVGMKKYATVGDAAHPTAQGLVTLGIVANAASVKTVFLYPNIYDVSVWIVKNPLGQFADHNPAVIPSPKAGKGEDDPLP
jgi:hypothetical protein